ncbi:MAG: ATP-binding protein [Chloroflexota bacterium]
MARIQAPFSTGAPALDGLIEELRAGDNVVFYTDDPRDYVPFVETMLSYAQRAGLDVVYVRASGLLDRAIAAAPTAIIVECRNLFPADEPARVFREAVRQYGTHLYYVLDPLTALEEWIGGEHGVRRFFLDVCPFLYELNTVAYWDLTRGAYAPSTVAAINDCTQLFMQIGHARGPEPGATSDPSRERDLSRERGLSRERDLSREIEITPIKVWGRYSEDMFRPHRVTLAGDMQRMQLQPVRDHGDAEYTQLLAAKNREMAEIRDALNRSNAELTARNRELAELNARLSEQSRLYQSLRGNLDHLLGVFQASQDIGSTLVLDQVRAAILAASRRLFDVTACALRLSATPGADASEMVSGALPAWSSATPAVVAMRQRVCDLLEPLSLRWPREAGAPASDAAASAAGHVADAGSTAIAPLLLHGRCVGTLELYADDARLDGDEPRTLLRYLASEASIALDNAHLYRQTELQREQLRSFIDQVITTEEQESRRFAYDLHDGLVQLVVAAFQHLQTAQALRGRDPDGETREFDHGMRLVRQSILESRRLISELRPAGLDDFGLLHALRVYVAQLAADAPWEVALEVDQKWSSLPASLEAALFRIIQEATTNARKYAQADRLRIALQNAPDRITVQVQDWGRGFDPDAVLAAPERGQHIGLIGIRERARLWGGTCHIESQIGRGTTVTITIPRSRITADGEHNGDDQDPARR